MKPEAGFWTRRLRPRLIREATALGLSAQFERVENAVANGTPDVDFCIAGVAGKMELKYTTRDPVRPGTPVLGRGNGLRRSQVVWVARYHRAGGNALLCVGTPTRTWLVPLARFTPRQLAGVELWPVAEYEAQCAWSDRHPSPLLLTLVHVNALTGADRPHTIARQKG